MRVRKRDGTGNGKILLTRFADIPSNRTGFCHICRLHRRRQACGERPLQPRPRRGEPCLTAGERSEPAEKAVTLTGLRRCPTTAACPAAARPYGRRCLWPQARYACLRQSIVGQLCRPMSARRFGGGTTDICLFLYFFLVLTKLGQDLAVSQELWSRLVVQCTLSLFFPFQIITFLGKGSKYPVKYPSTNSSVLEASCVSLHG